MTADADMTAPMSGAELDAEVERCVFGRTDIDQRGWHAEYEWQEPMNGYDYRRRCVRCGSTESGIGPIRVRSGPCIPRVPAYSTALSAAMTILDRWENYDIKRRNGESFSVELFIPSREFKAYGRTLPEAICLAALKAATALRAVEGTEAP